jgi:hypothetical protein
MQVFNLSEGGHEWEKVNIVTIEGKRPHDIYKCKRCGLTGKSYRLGTIEIPERSIPKMELCRGLQRGTSIKITHCNACGEEFRGLVPGSIHQIVSPPDGQDNKRGEWVMGQTEPVLVLFGEFMYFQE